MEREIILQKFGENLKRIRESKGLTQEAVAYNSGLSRSYYAEVELGRRNPSLINLTRIAEALQQTVSELLINLS